MDNSPLASRLTLATQCKLLPGSRCRHVSESFVLVPLTQPDFALDPLHQRVFLRAARVDRRKQQFRAVMRRSLEPDHQLRLIAPRDRGETRNDHMVELQAFGLVDRHDLERRVRRRVGSGKQQLQRLFECNHVDQSAMLVFVPGEVSKELLGFPPRRFRGEARGPAEQQPRLFDPA